MTRELKTGMITAALLLGGSLALVLLRQAGVVHGDRGELSVRGLNVMLGLIEVGFASASAKHLRRLANVRNPELEQSLRRFSAWTLATGGAIYALAWLVAPYELAFYISVAGLGGSVLLVVARCMAARRPPAA